MGATSGILALTLLAMGGGHLLARRGLLTPPRTRRLARFLADVAFPLLCLLRIAPMDGATLRAGAGVPIAVILLLALSALLGEGLARAARIEPRHRPGVHFCAALPNWIFLPLPIAAWLYGEAGVLVVLLGNVGAQLFLWTAGVALQSGARRLDLWGLLKNPGLIATAAGIAVALLGLAAPPWPVFAAGRWLLERVGDSAVWLTPFAVGAQLGIRPRWTLDRSLAVILVVRLLLAPLLVALALALRPALFDSVTRQLLVLIAGMPVAFSASALALRFGGDDELAARAVVASTLLAGATVPALQWLLPRLG